MARVLYLITFVGGLAGLYFLYAALTAATGAPQEASLAAIGIACAAIPYCMARAVQEMDR